MAASAPSLWDAVAESDAANRTPLSLQADFEEWLATPDGQRVLREVIRRARSLRAVGFRQFGIGAIWEAIRYDRAVALGPDINGYALNNNWRSRIARHVMDTCPDLGGFFSTRELTA